jgi:TorA maturation chaperone TorD
VIELVRALAAFLEPTAPEHARLAHLLGLDAAPTAAAHTEMFTLQLYPYASVYLGAEGQLGGDARDRIAGFIRALGGTPPPQPDHLGVLLHLYADLADNEATTDSEAARPRLRHARHTLLWEHLLPWLPMYLAKAQTLAPAPFREWATLLQRTLHDEADVLGEVPKVLPAHLRDAPRLPDPREEPTDAFLAGLLAPVRSGLILTRTDLTSAGRTLGLGVRVGERAFTLRALAGQDAPAVLAWLAGAARTAAEGYAAHDWAGPIGPFWTDRARATAKLLDELAADAAADLVPTKK